MLQCYFLSGVIKIVALLLSRQSSACSSTIKRRMRLQKTWCPKSNVVLIIHSKRTAVLKIRKCSTTIKWRMIRPPQSITCLAISIRLTKPVTTKTVREFTVVFMKSSDEYYYVGRDGDENSLAETQSRLHQSPVPLVMENSSGLNSAASTLEPYGNVKILSKGSKKWLGEQPLQILKTDMYELNQNHMVQKTDTNSNITIHTGKVLSQ